MKRGYFITFEGGEGSGKSIQVQILVSHLREEGHTVIVTREPGGTRIGEQIRHITHDTENVDLNATAEAYLMAASRAQHVAEIIEPALKAGNIVVCDRYVDSSIAYQGYGRKLGAEVIANLNALAVNGAIPDLTIFLDVSPQTGIKRRQAGSKSKDRLDLQQRDFYTRVHEGYIRLVKDHKDRYVAVDASSTIEVVASQIWNVVKEKLDTHHGTKQ